MLGRGTGIAETFGQGTSKRVRLIDAGRGEGVGALATAGKVPALRNAGP